MRIAARRAPSTRETAGQTPDGTRLAEENLLLRRLGRRGNRRRRRPRRSGRLIALEALQLIEKVWPLAALRRLARRSTGRGTVEDRARSASVARVERQNKARHEEQRPKDSRSPGQRIGLATPGHEAGNTAAA